MKCRGYVSSSEPASPRFFVQTSWSVLKAGEEDEPSKISQKSARKLSGRLSIRKRMVRDIQHGFLMSCHTALSYYTKKTYYFDASCWQNGNQVLGRRIICSHYLKTEFQNIRKKSNKNLGVHINILC